MPCKYISQYARTRPQTRSNIDADWSHAGILVYQHHEHVQDAAVKSFQTPSLYQWALNATSQPQTPTHTYLPTATMPDSRLPDISLQMLFSMSRPHIFWYSWKTEKKEKKKSNRWRWAPVTQVRDGGEVEISADLHGGEACCERTGWRWTGTRPFPLCFRQQSRVSVAQTHVKDE